MMPYLAGVGESLVRDDALPCRSHGILGQRWCLTLQEPWNPWPEMVPYLAGVKESLARDGALPCRSHGILGQRWCLTLRSHGIFGQRWCLTLQEPWNPWPEMVPYLAGAMESLARDGALPCRSHGILGPLFFLFFCHLFLDTDGLTDHNASLAPKADRIVLLSFSL